MPPTPLCAKDCADALERPERSDPAHRVDQRSVEPGALEARSNEYPAYQRDRRDDRRDDRYERDEKKAPKRPSGVPYSDWHADCQSFWIIMELARGNTTQATLNSLSSMFAHDRA